MSAEPIDDGTSSFDLVRQAQAGDKDALDRLIRRYYERVRKIVRVRLGPDLRTRLDSGDILQETFIASVHALDRFEVREEASLINWLSKIAENKVKDAAKYLGAEKRDHGRDVHAPSGASEPVQEGPSVIEGLAREEDIDLIEVALDGLREDYRKVILHRDYAGANWGQIATWMDSPSPDAARMLYARAIVELSGLVRRRIDSR